MVNDYCCHYTDMTSACTVKSFAYIGTRLAMAGTLPSRHRTFLRQRAPCNAGALVGIGPFFRALHMIDGFLYKQEFTYPMGPVSMLSRALVSFLLMVFHIPRPVGCLAPPSLNIVRENTPSLPITCRESLHAEAPKPRPLNCC